MGSIHIELVGKPTISGKIPPGFQIWLKSIGYSLMRCEIIGAQIFA